ncbi:phage shock protein PspA [Thalassotalea sp. PLHSN55]|uniref:phage shock protein PspA n=1 Tax=Thalassotalea sp. PLHSN55 TaxID=3435888 RepID=UPI003F841675
MGIFARFTDIVNANLNSMLDKAEHPEKMIRLIIQEMEETLVEVRATAAQQIAQKKGLQRKILNLNKTVANWQAKAEIAIGKGREDLAKSALTEKHKAAAQLEQVQAEMVELDDILTKIQDDSARLQEKLTEAKRRQEAYVMRQKSAEVRLKVRHQAVVHNIEDAITKFERYQQKVDAVEAQVEAFDMTTNQDLSSQINALETQDTIEKELQEIKQRVANS